jgi:hypothetical protein
MALGIQNRRVMMIPNPIEPKMVYTREVLNFQKINVIVTRGAFEFCIAKIAIPMAINRTIQ